jgi:hypothetical protein
VLVVLLDTIFPGPRGWLPFLPPLAAKGIVPLVLAGLLLFEFVRFVRRRYAATGEETAQAIFTLAFSAFVILTLTGALFRGRGMALVAPWGR